ncbi:TPR repeat domain protein [Candidatus Rhodobacter oscarellae]|uniref:Tetratricopeptide repeat protein 38 n=1 Tax=Candidatus Rhodobacter oscarellae TaxID=1675527 RepID=A0A0J9H1R3_9RHOB|nr:tetratricopeptide repeat protein [Candidatus Rhodobacter lobularis]KMW59658.1 TPR repeat domain protein [Candidatus Rhodobacter lobularis]
MKNLIHSPCATGATETAIKHYDAALRAFNIYRGDPVALCDQAIDSAPEFAMAYILKAYLFGLATEPEAASEAKTILETAKRFAKTEQEISHLAALEALLGNNWTEAAVRLDRHNNEFPYDILGLQAGHLMDFYRANARNLRDRLARVLPKWSEDQPGYSVVLGMYAFGLEEAGDYVQAEAVGKEAIERDPLDCWAHHAVAHVLEMQGRAEEGIKWMSSREPHWSGDDNFFKVHNWWHNALYHLDVGKSEKVIQLYDARVRGEESQVALDLVDASALLWRLHMEGHDVGDRWTEVANSWDAHADGRLYPFNDWHAAMAYLGAGRESEVDRILDQYRTAGESEGETARWAQVTGMPLIQGFRSFWAGQYDQAVDILHPARFIANSFGGSHAQRDVIDWTLTEAAVRSGKIGAAEALAAERLAVNPHSPINNSFLKRAKPSHKGHVAAE